MDPGIRYQLKQLCLLVDAKHSETGRRIPEEIPSAHILDQRTKPYTYLKLSDGAAFIARFLVLGVDVALIPEILRSEYSLTSQNKERGVDFEADVDSVIKMLGDYIEVRTSGMPYSSPETLGRGENECGYPLDFGVHSPGYVCCKIPPIRILS
jgi:hypothetical protein